MKENARYWTAPSEEHRLLKGSFVAPNGSMIHGLLEQLDHTMTHREDVDNKSLHSFASRLLHHPLQQRYFVTWALPILMANKRAYRLGDRQIQVKAGSFDPLLLHIASRHSHESHNLIDVITAQVRCH